jgi:hypothetical protein
MRVDVEAVFNEGVKVTAPFIGLLEGLDRLVFELPHGNQGFEIGIGHYSFGQLDSCYSQRPYIGLVSIFVMFHDFGTHPVGTAYLRLVSCIGVHALSGYTEVREFCYALLVEEDVGCLDVTVYLFVLMQVDEALEHRLEDGGDLALAELLLRDVEQVDDTACVTVLQHDPEVVVLEVGAIVFDDVFVVAEPQDLDFLFNRRDLRKTGGREDLDSVEVARALVERFADGAIGALSEDIQQLELFFWVARLGLRQKGVRL